MIFKDKLKFAKHVCDQAQITVNNASDLKNHGHFDHGQDFQVEPHNEAVI